MKKEHLQYLVCPFCKNELMIYEVHKEDLSGIESGSLLCSRCEKVFEIIRYIPRFVCLENYANSFGLQWAKHSKTQYDSYNGSNISETRFFSETRWPGN